MNYQLLVFLYCLLLVWFVGSQQVSHKLNDVVTGTNVNAGGSKNIRNSQYDIGNQQYR